MLRQGINDRASIAFKATQRDLNWTRFLYLSMLLKSGETLAVSNEIFETPYRVYPKTMPHEPKRNREGIRH